MSDQSGEQGLNPSQFPTAVGVSAGPVVLGGNELRKRVGQGGMGEVWLAWDVKLHRNVALKTMRPDWAKNSDAAARFYTEARAVAKLNHPNITQIYQIGEDKGLLFFTMEWVDGQSLDGYLKERRVLATSEAVRITLQILEGLHFAHQNQVIHRDIKPGNCLMDKQGRIKLADFGLAKLMDSDTSLTSTGVSMGSPNYMSPEMAKGETADHRSDMYAVGLTLYQMLTGELAFSAPTATAVLLKQVNDDLPISEKLTSKAGPDLIAIIQRMCAKRPADRYSTYEEVIAALRQVESRLSGGGDPLASAEARTVQLDSVTDSPPPIVEIPATWAPGPSAIPAADRPPLSGEVVVKTPESRGVPITAIVAVAIVAIVAVGAVVMLSRGDRDWEDSPAAVRAPSERPSLRGEIAVPGVEPAEFAGVRVQLFGDVAREQFMISANHIRDLRREIAPRQQALRANLRQIREAGTLATLLRDGPSELATRTRERDELQARGSAAYNESERLRESIVRLKENLAEFERLGHSNLPVEDPVTRQQVIVTAAGGKKGESIERMQRMIAAGETELAKARQAMSTLASQFEEKKQAVASLEEKLELTRRELSRINLEELRTTFRASFRELADLQRELVREESRLSGLTPATGEVASVTVGANGAFEFGEIQPGRYVMRVSADVTRRADGSSTEVTLLWIMEEEVKPTGSARVALSGSNALVQRRLETRALIAQGRDDEDVAGGLGHFLRPDHREDAGLPFTKWVNAVIAD